METKGFEEEFLNGRKLSQGLSSEERQIDKDSTLKVQGQQQNEVIVLTPHSMSHLFCFFQCFLS